MEPISACIIVLNEEKNIRDCLESVKWADEIVVVDAFSEDQTVSICQEYTDRVFQRKWTGFYDQVSFVFQSARNSWILYIEADERLSSELKEEIQREFSLEKISGDGFSVPRLSHSLGRWIYHGGWYPDRLNRIFRKEKLSLIGPDPHLQMRIQGPVKKLEGDLLHYTGPNVSWILRKTDNYADAFAQAKMEEGKTCRLWDLIVRPPMRFFKSYFFKAGFLDGKQGFLLAILGSFYVFTKYIKLWELEQFQRSSKGETE